MADFEKVDNPVTTERKKRFHAALTAFGAVENISLDVLMALCLDAILHIHLNTSGPQYTDEKMLAYITHVTAQYREAFKKAQN